MASSEYINAASKVVKNQCRCLSPIEEAEFPYIKKQTGATAGNLSVQIDKLSCAGYIEVEKTFKGKKPCTLCRITPEGQKAFEGYVDALKFYLEVN